MSGPSSPLHEDEGPGPITEINVTPLVDIMLVLLIIFMATASLISSPALKVELPRGGAAATTAQEPDVVVVVTRTGAIQFKDRPIQAERLVEELKQEQRGRPSARLLIVADTKAYHGNVVRIMDLAKTVGFKRLGVAINPAAAAR